MSQLVEDRVQRARDACHRHAWHEAFDLLREAADASLAQDLAMLAESAWFAESDAAIEARERAHLGYLDEGDKCYAAEMALQIALDHFERLESAIGNGWLGKAKRLLDQPRRLCSAWMACPGTGLSGASRRAILKGLRQARIAQEFGERLGIPAMQALAMAGQGRALISKGKIDEGLALIDESAVTAISGELDPLTTGKIYCNTISICRDLADWRRAIEWTDAAERWCHRQNVSGFPGICRVFRAEIMDFRGSWPTQNGRPSAHAKNSFAMTCWSAVTPSTRSARSGFALAT